MATVTHAVITADTGATPNTSGAFTPAENDLLVAFVVASATSDATVTLTNTAGIGFAQVGVATHSTNVSNLFGLVSTSLVSAAQAVSQTVTADMPADPASGTIIMVARVAGMSRVGLDAVRQFKVANGQSGSADTLVLDAAVLTSNPIFAAAFKTGSASAIPSPSGWTEGGDVTYASPNMTGAYAWLDSGFTDTDIVWTAGLGNGGFFGLELDASVPSGGGSAALLYAYYQMLRGG